jgi:hypothetical protein
LLGLRVEPKDTAVRVRRELVSADSAPDRAHSRSSAR